MQTSAKSKGNIRLAPTSSLTEHPLACLVPGMRPSEWQDFYADIAFRGIITPLEVLDGTVVDGKHRLKAAKQLNLPQVPIIDAPLTGESPAVYMLKAAILRRHLSDSQRATMAELWKEENKKPRGQASPQYGKSAPRRAEMKDTSPTRAEATEFFKIPRRKIDQASKVHQVAPELFERVHQGEIALNNAYRQVKGQAERAKIANTKPPTGTYQVIVIDPPWPYTSRQWDPSHQITSPYEPMPIEKLKELKIPAAPNSVLWLWVPNTFLHDAFHVLEAWGFKYRITLTWAKNFVGLGDWLGGQTEHCLLATKGNYHIFRNNESTLLEAPRTKHSQKPGKFYELVEGLCPGEKIDMFARTTLQGWTTWGAEIDE